MNVDSHLGRIPISSQHGVQGNVSVVIGAYLRRSCQQKKVPEGPRGRGDTLVPLGHARAVEGRLSSPGRGRDIWMLHGLLTFLKPAPVTQGSEVPILPISTSSTCKLPLLFVSLSYCPGKPGGPWDREDRRTSEEVTKLASPGNGGLASTERKTKTT